jgi:hypothetical protein
MLGTSTCNTIKAKTPLAARSMELAVPIPACFLMRDHMYRPRIYEDLTFVFSLD